METKSKLRTIAWVLQMIAVLAFYLPPLVWGSYVSIGWLIFGVVHIGLFCVVFYRDAKTRTAIAIILSIIIIIGCAATLLMGALLALLQSAYGPDPIISIFVCALASLFAIIFALAKPRAIAINTPPPSV
jgi:FtsH-binding integral membrane protein